MKSVFARLSQFINIKRTAQKKIALYTNNIVGDIGQMVDNVELLVRSQYLRDKTINSVEPGVTSANYCEREIVVSLTTYGGRLYEVYLAIESIMQGTMKPNHIVLWLAEDELKEKPLPLTLQLQVKRGLEIRYCKDIKSYKKLIPTLKIYPESIIITIDDDVIYNYDLVERLFNCYIENTDCICANRINKICFEDNGCVCSYLKWGKERVIPNTIDKLYFFTGVGGVLYPAHIMPDEIFKEEVFMSLCQYGDDIWFYAMATINGVQIKKSDSRDENGNDFYPIIEVQKGGLCEKNNMIGNCRNDVQIKAVFEKYGICDLLKQ